MKLLLLLEAIKKYGVGRYTVINVSVWFFERLGLQVIGNATMAKRGIMIACNPKSGSSYLLRKLGGLSWYPAVSLRSHSDIQELSRMLIEEYRDKTFIDQIHLMCTEYAIDCINRLDPVLIILERNIIDLMVSIRDFINSEEIKSITDKENIHGWMCIDKTFYEMSKEEQGWFVIDMIAPWYVKFHVSWRQLQDRLHRAPLYLTYDLLFEDPTQVMAMVSRYCELDVGWDRVVEVVETSEFTRLNKGVVGRGLTELTSDQITRVESIARHYPAHADELITWRTDQRNDVGQGKVLEKIANLKCNSGYEVQKAVHLERVEQEYRHGNAAKAISILLELLRSYPNCYEVLRDASVILECIGEREKAQVLLKRVITIHPEAKEDRKVCELLQKL